MRVIAGTARSLKLKTPDGQDTRPTTDRIKETLFNMLQTYIPDCVFVDIFSGSGGIGIEALSRGARKAYFIENAPKAIACIEQNLAFTKFTDRAIVLKQDVGSALSSIYEKKVDIIFMDPPYNQLLEKEVLTHLSDSDLIHEDSLIIVEPWSVMGIDEIHLEEYILVSYSIQGFLHASCHLITCPVLLPFCAVATVLGKEAVPLTHPASENSSRSIVVHGSVPDISIHVWCAVVPVFSHQIHILLYTVHLLSHFSPNILAKLVTSSSAHFR